jgi:hypothetical protein
MTGHVLIAVWSIGGSVAVIYFIAKVVAKDKNNR